MTEFSQREEASKSFQEEPHSLPLGISILKLSKTFSAGFQLGRKMETSAVNSLSLNVYEGQITIIVGRNGAGKTTLM